MTSAASEFSPVRAPVWSVPFRPFFLGASLWSALSLAAWIGLLASSANLPSRFDPLTWHIHAMLFGFVFAAIAGFLLTAIPNWTARPPIGGWLLIMLVAVWIAGRVACVVSAFLPLWLAAALDVAFPAVLAGVCAHELFAARNWRNLMMPIPVAALGVADLLMHQELAGVGIPAGLGWRLGLAAAIALITAVSGRIIPAFTRNWLVKRGATRFPAAHDWLDGAALATLHAALLAWAFLPNAQPVAALLIIAGLLNLWRLVRWRGVATFSEPLLAILHVGYLWIVLGALLLGISMLADSVPQAAAVHAFTAGAIGTMSIAVMTRVSRGHTGRPLEADLTTTLIYGLIVVAGATRVAAGLAGSGSMILYEISAALWVASFLLFAFSYGPMLVSPRPDETVRRVR